MRIEIPAPVNDAQRGENPRVCKGHHGRIERGLKHDGGQVGCRRGIVETHPRERVNRPFKNELRRIGRDQPGQPVLIFRPLESRGHHQELFQGDQFLDILRRNEIRRQKVDHLRLDAGVKTLPDRDSRKRRGHALGNRPDCVEILRLTGEIGFGRQGSVPRDHDRPAPRRFSQTQNCGGNSFGIKADSSRLHPVQPIEGESPDGDGHGQENQKLNA